MLNNILYTIKKYIPRRVFIFFQPAYHYCLALFAAIIYGFPSRKLTVVGVTGTKGKSSTAEIVASILKEDGHKVALVSTVHFKIGDREKPNLYKMTLPGRMFLQRFLRRAVSSGCDYAVVELTSEGARLFRHKYLALDALIFTNLSPEHIESHGSFEKYLLAKLSLAKSLEGSPKKQRVIVANADDPYGKNFLAFGADKKLPFSLDSAMPYSVKKTGVQLTFGKTNINSALLGLFNIYNILAAATFAKGMGIDEKTIVRGIEKVRVIPGRVEKVTMPASHQASDKQNFSIFVDYAHTADSMKQLYEAFPDERKVCVFGATGGGRDVWKRKEMGSVADKYCEIIILTNDDPYDEDPISIINDIRSGIRRIQPIVEPNRREAIRIGLSSANEGDVVLISGKGSDPYLMLKNNTRLPWSDVDVSKEELVALLEQK